MIHLAFQPTLPHLSKKDDWDFDNIMTFDTFEDFNNYLLMLQKSNQKIPEDLIPSDHLQELKDDYKERMAYYGQTPDLLSDDSEIEDDDNCENEDDFSENDDNLAQNDDNSSQNDDKTD